MAEIVLKIYVTPIHFIFLIKVMQKIFPYTSDLTSRVTGWVLFLLREASARSGAYRGLVFVFLS